jgi:Protein of unknown function (DUF2934)
MSSPREINRPAEKAGPAASGVPVELAIRRRAYELYQQRGGGEGRAVEDWLRAEKEIRQNTGNRKAA